MGSGFSPQHSATCLPVPLATSGSAPAHWYPRVIEARETGLPLVPLSTDRPPTLRGFCANRTIDQTRLFGPFAREAQDPGLQRADDPALKAIRWLARRCAGVAAGPRPGPVQINPPFDEPLVPATDCDAGLPADHPGPPCWALPGDLSAVRDLSGWLLQHRIRSPVVVIKVAHRKPTASSIRGPVHGADRLLVQGGGGSCEPLRRVVEAEGARPAC